MIKKQRLKSDFKIKSATINNTFDNILNICFSSVLNTFCFFFIQNTKVYKSGHYFYKNINARVGF